MFFHALIHQWPWEPLFWVLEVGSPRRGAAPAPGEEGRQEGVLTTVHSTMASPVKKTERGPRTGHDRVGGGEGSRGLSQGVALQQDGRVGRSSSSHAGGPGRDHAGHIHGAETRLRGREPSGQGEPAGDGAARSMRGA